ncbi:thiamine-phosphate kinase [Actinotalea sp. M2MS4P-6]|uniref:thiamine-phosphate kinase n=1 Tax=Actinotalea sp. M2MS4P-6 TaxID=2983762 RepID=UPI0021E468F0|nr:thiamine-phosphate kinase [Actinotalea sp. M2MS4P-6]MCV2393989.1 thiamine-phosphate kinase [Actinotalea sp. M2MS4P-6]
MTDEDALLARILPRLPFGRDTLLGPGDDAAIVAAPDGRVVVSTDVLVDGRHFRRSWSSGADVGYRAAVQNLADVAAMGARPTALVVALVCPPDVTPDWLADLAGGLAEACGDVGVVGGDLSAGTELSVAVTVLGDLEGRAPVRRDGARPGDVVAHAGHRGRSVAGLGLLEAGLDAGHEGFGALVEAYRRPTAPLAAGIAAARAGATAMLDVSDGLLRDAQRLALASGVGLDLAAASEVFGDELAALAPAAVALGVDATTWVLTGGEDHGLLATFPADVALPEPFRRIGRVLDGPAGRLTVAGEEPQGPLGWDHFAR